MARTLSIGWQPRKNNMNENPTQNFYASCFTYITKYCNSELLDCNLKARCLIFVEVINIQFRLRNTATVINEGRAQIIKK